MKKYFFILLVICLFIPCNIKAEELKFAKTSKSALMLEVSTGKILFEKNIDERREPASMTKIMTMLLIMESLDKGIISLDEMVTVSANASSMGGSQILLETGEKMSVKDLLTGISVASGNDAAVAMAEKIGGSVPNFVNMMNKRAKELGCKNTNFENPHGLTSPNHYSTARDMSLIARELLKYKDILKYTSIYETYLRENLDTKIWLVNTNKLVRFYEGLDGLKTGFTNSAGYCLTATALRNNMRLLTVLMGSESSKIRNAETTELLDYGFSQYKIKNIITSKDNLGKIKIEKGKNKYSKLIIKDDATLLSKKGDNEKNTTYKIILDKVKAPIKKGDKVGVAEIYEDNNKINEIELTIDKDNNKISLLKLYFRNIKNVIFGE